MSDHLIEPIYVVQTASRIAKTGRGPMMRLFQGVEPHLYDAVNALAKNALSEFESLDSDVHEAAYAAVIGASLLVFESYRWACLSLWLDTDFGRYLVDPERKKRKLAEESAAESQSPDTSE